MSDLDRFKLFDNRPKHFGSEFEMLQNKYQVPEAARFRLFRVINPHWCFSRNLVPALNDTVKAAAARLAKPLRRSIDVSTHLATRHDRFDQQSCTTVRAASPEARRYGSQRAYGFKNSKSCPRRGRYPPILSQEHTAHVGSLLAAHS